MKNPLEFVEPLVDSVAVARDRDLWSSHCRRLAPDRIDNPGRRVGPHAHIVEETTVKGKPSIVSIAIVAFALAGSAQAATPNLSKCLELTTAHAMSVNIDDLGIPAQVKRAARARIVTYNSLKGFAGLEGIGLTPEQISAIQSRIDAKVASWNAHPLGWPCAPFTHRMRTVAWIRETLVDNGFRRSSIRVTKAVPRQLQFVGIQDGIDVWMTVARTGPKGVAIRLTTTHSGGGTYAYVLPFVP